MMYECPWCGKTSDYTYSEVYNEAKQRWVGDPNASVRRMSCEKIECVCPECRGEFNLIPEFRVEEFYVWVPVGKDWDQDYYDYGQARQDYYDRHHPPREKFSLGTGFSLPAPGKFSLFSRRRMR